MCAGILVLQAIIVGLCTPVLITIADVSTPLALGIGLGLALACVVVSGLLRAEWGYTVGWVLQGLTVAVGFLVPMMFLVGALFAMLWATAYFLGLKIERERAAAWAAYDAERGA